MGSRAIVGLMMCVLFTANAAAQTAAPSTLQPGIEVLPTPQPMIVERIIIPGPILRDTRDSREVWNNFAVDAYGRFRPRVILAPYESSYYYRNGAPYRFFPSRNLSLKPSAN